MRRAVALSTLGLLLAACPRGDAGKASPGAKDGSAPPAAAATAAAAEPRACAAARRPLDPGLLRAGGDAARATAYREGFAAFCAGAAGRPALAELRGRAERVAMDVDAAGALRVAPEAWPLPGLIALAVGVAYDDAAFAEAARLGSAEDQAFWGGHATAHRPSGTPAWRGDRVEAGDAGCLDLATVDPARVGAALAAMAAATAPEYRAMGERATAAFLEDLAAVADGAGCLCRVEDARPERLDALAAAGGPFSAVATRARAALAARGSGMVVGPDRRCPELPGSAGQ